MSKDTLLLMSEKLSLVGYEIKWTVNWFHQKGNQWKQQLRDLNDEKRPPGMGVYCHKQVALWGWAPLQIKCRIGSPLNWVDHYSGSLI